MKNLCVLFFLIVSAGLYSQNNLENANWIFGNTLAGATNTCWMDFNNNLLVSPSVPPYGATVTGLTPQPVYSAIEGCASISDEDGNLLFYTDGRRVYRPVNGNIEIIDYNSTADELSGHFSSVQNTIIIPSPSGERRYYLISITGFSSFPRTFSWSELDLDMNQFVSRNNIMQDDSTIFNGAFNNINECITSCVHANGRDVWIIAHLKNITPTYSKILSYLVTPTGINVAPSGSFDMPLTTRFPSYSLKVSPDATTIALSRGAANPVMGTFNNVTGEIVMNLTEIGDTSVASGHTISDLEFSPNSQILYFSRQILSSDTPRSGIFAVNLSNPTVEYVVFDNHRMAGLQRGLNNRIYGTYNEAVSLLEITNPNSSSPVTADFNLNTGQMSGLGLPQWIWPTCKNTLTLTRPAHNINGTNSRRERAQWIKASNTIQASTATNVVYHAGNFIELRPGFEEKSGARVSAYIEGCSNNYSYRHAMKDENPVAEDSKKLKTDFIISPNPSQNFIDLTIDNDMFIKITVASMDGKMILDKQVEPTSFYNIDISRYASGIYIVNVISKDGKQYSRKLIKK